MLDKNDFEFGKPVLVIPSEWGKLASNNQHIEEINIPTISLFL